MSKRPPARDAAGLGLLVARADALVSAQVNHNIDECILISDGAVIA